MSAIDVSAAPADLAALRQVAFAAGYRMLGTRSEADDVAQEALLRLSEPLARGEVRNAEAYITTVATRLAIDHLRSARVRREQYVGPWLPEPIVVEEPGALADEVSYALLVVLETLGPVERAAFLLREVFGFDYADIAAALDRSEDACRQLVTRARRRVEAGRPTHQVDRATHRRLVERFIAAAGGGDLDALQAMLTEEVELVSDGGAHRKAARHPIRGREKVVRFVRSIVPRLSQQGDWSIVTVNGEPGFRLLTDVGVLLVGTVIVSENRIAGIRWVLNPDKLP
jgi:RNA polymerase sigma-70 factor, ECF subfamily